MDKAEAFACGAVFLPKHLNDTDHFGIEADCAWDLASVLSRMLRRGLSFMGILARSMEPLAGRRHENVHRGQGSCSTSALHELKQRQHRNLRPNKGLSFP